MKWYALVAVLLIVLVPFVALVLSYEGEGCVEGVLDAVSQSEREIVISGKTYDLRGIFYDDNGNILTAWDVPSLLEDKAGSKVYVCHDEEGKVTLIRYDGKTLIRYEPEEEGEERED